MCNYIFDCGLEGEGEQLCPLFDNGVDRPTHNEECLATCNGPLGAVFISVIDPQSCVETIGSLRALSPEFAQSTCGETCDELCNRIFDCGLQPDGGVQLCPAFDNGVDRESYNAGCTSDCSGPLGSALRGAADREGCADVINDLSLISTDFASTCSGGP
ncbi:MAG: hypothetical protein AAGA56_09110 [Myxococcota bacterium]